MGVVGLGYPRTEAETVAGVVPVNYQVPVGYVERYGAVGDGNGHDTAAIGAAIAVTREMRGGRVVFQPTSYFLGDFSDSLGILNVSDLSDVVFEGNGAELVCNTTDQSQPTIFSLLNPRNLTFNDLRFMDAGTDLNVDWRGAWALWFEASGSPSHPLGGIQINNCSATSVVGFLRIVDETSPFTYRIRNITLVNCRVSDSYYGINCRENGDDLAATNFRCENVRRAYFPYGVTNHNVDLSIYHDGMAPGSNGCVEIARYRRDTTNIKVRAVFEGSGQSYDSYVNLQHGPNNDPGGLIEDVDIDVHANRLAPNSGFVVSFRSYRGEQGTSGMEETTTTTNRWDRIRIGGNFGNGVNVPNPISIPVKQETEGVLSLDPTMTETVDQALPHYPGFVVRLAHDREVRTLHGPLPTQTVLIPLAQLDANAFALRVSVYAHDDAAALAVQNATYSEDVIIGYNAGGPAPVSIQGVQNLHTVAQGIAASITYSASGENLVVGFGGDAYSNPNAFARVEVQYIGRGPQY